MAKLRNIIASFAALLIAGAGACLAAAPESVATVVEFETPIASKQPLQGLLRQTSGTGPSPAVVLLHGCNGNWRRLDQRWGKQIASWGYVTLTVDSFGPRGLTDTCDNGAPVDLAFDAYRALSFLAQQPFVDAARVAAVGFSQGGWLALSSVERGIIEQASSNKFRAVVAFYPPCRGFRDNMTVPTLILTGELDDWSPADECRKMLDGLDDWGISRQKGDSGAPESSSSSTPMPTTPSMRRGQSRRNFWATGSNTTRRRRISRSALFVNFLTQRSARTLLISASSNGAPF